MSLRCIYSAVIKRLTSQDLDVNLSGAIFLTVHHFLHSAAFEQISLRFESIMECDRSARLLHYSCFYPVVIIHIEREANLVVFY